VQEPCILPDPGHASRLIMLYSGVPTSDRTVCFVGKAWADLSDPLTWHQAKTNPVFNPTGGTAWDSHTLRLDSVLYIPEKKSFYIYYSASQGPVQDHIGLAICPVGKNGYDSLTPERIKRFGNAPVLAPEPAAPYFEEMSSQAAVWRERGPVRGTWNWYMYYSYRGKDGILPGIRLATSSDGKTWTRHFNAADPRGMGQIFPSTPKAYYEWHQISKMGRTYVLSIEVGINHGERWRPVIAVSPRPDSGWAQLDPDTVLQTKWKGIYRDDALFHVATPAFYQFGGKWYLYTQACPRPGNGNYIDGHWDMWGFTCDRQIPTLPGLTDISIP
jgi:hypothetical protein